MTDLVKDSCALRPTQYLPPMHSMALANKDLCTSSSTTAAAQALISSHRETLRELQLGLWFRRRMILKQLALLFPVGGRSCSRRAADRSYRVRK